MGYLNRLKSIEVQLLKTITFTPSDEQLVAMTQSILRAVLRAAEDADEDLVGAVTGAELPTTLLGVSVDWDESNPEGDSFTLTLNGITVTQDADDAIQEIISGGGTSHTITGQISGIPVTDTSVAVYAYKDSLLASLEVFDPYVEAEEGFPNAEYSTEGISNGTTFDYELEITDEDEYHILAYAWPTGDQSSGTYVGSPTPLNVNQSHSNIDFVQIHGPENGPEPQ